MFRDIFFAFDGLLIDVNKYIPINYGTIKKTNT
jgi:hypothetical protein